MKKSILLISVVLLLGGCEYRHMDYRDDFLFKGVVFDKATKLPLDRVVIAFEDTGFDYIRSQKTVRLIVGESDISGMINMKFTYSWGYNVGMFKKKPSKTFNVIVSKIKYKEKILNFKASDLIVDGDMLTVPLGELFLELSAE